MTFGGNLDWLLTHRGYSRQQLADKLEVKVNTIANYINGVSMPKYDILEKIIKFLDVTADVILFSDLPMDGIVVEPARSKGVNARSKDVIVGAKDIPNTVPISVPNHETSGILPLPRPSIITMDTQGNENIVFVPIKAAAGYLNGYGDPEWVERLPAYRVPGFEQGTYRMFEINGHSMMPTFKNRDKIIGKWCDLKDIRDSFVHVIITRTDGVVVKRVLNRLEKDGVLILKSDGNRYEYPDMIVDASDILECWSGAGKFSRDLSGPNDLFSRLDDAEGRLAMIENMLKQNQKSIK